MDDSHGRFVWYELLTTEVAGASAFYSKVMGWGVRDASTPAMPYALFTAGEEPVCGLINLPVEAQRMGARPRWMGYVGVTDVDATAARVEGLGGTVLVPPTDVPDVSRISIVGDVHMATLALIKGREAGQAQRSEPGSAGRVGWHELLAADGEAALAFYSALFGWRKVQTEKGPVGTYQMFSAAGETIGGMFTKSATVTESFWLYYFNVADIDVALENVTAHGGRIVEGLLEVWDDSCVARCVDPQGAIFALEGKRSRKAAGYFERAGSNERRPGRRWSW